MQAFKGFKDQGQGQGLTSLSLSLSLSRVGSDPENADPGQRTPINPYPGSIQIIRSAYLRFSTRDYISVLMVVVV